MPPHGHIGRPGVDDRRVIAGILYVLQTGCQWQWRGGGSDDGRTSSLPSEPCRDQAGYGHSGEELFRAVFGMMPWLLSSSLAFHPEPPDRVASQVAELGFDGVEFLCEPPWHPEAWSPGLVCRVRTAGIELSVHVPVADLNLMSPHPGIRAFTKEEIAATLRLAAEIEASTVTFHLGYRPAMGTAHEPSWPVALEAIRRLEARSETCGIALCLENDP